jgi:hypothetical protein
MADWTSLKSAIAQYIKQNGEADITGDILQDVLINIVSNLGFNATFAGIAHPTTNPGSQDGPVFYFAFEDGTYNNFGGIVIENEVCILSRKLDKTTDEWLKMDTGLATATLAIELKDYFRRVEEKLDAFIRENPDSPLTIRVATKLIAGIVQIGDNIDVNGSGVISVPIASANRAGVVKPGEGVSISPDGTISVAGGSGAGYDIDTNENLLKVYDENDNTYVTRVERLENPNPPTLSANSEDYYVSGGTKNVVITNTSSGGTVYYTTDGTTPSTSSPSFTSATKTITLTIDTSTAQDTKQVKAIIVKNGLSSTVATGTYVMKRKVSTPVVARNDNSNIYSSSCTVKLTCATDGVVMYYTTDGSTPTTSSTQYTAPFGITSTKTVKVLAVKSDWGNSDIASETITLNTKKMWYQAVDNAPTTEGQILALSHSIEANSFPPPSGSNPGGISATFTESGSKKGCFCYDKDLGNLTKILEVESGYDKFSDWTKTEVGNWNVYTANTAADFQNAEFRFIK